MGKDAPSGPVWRVPRYPLPASVRRIAAQPIAITDLTMPNGRRYRVQISPERPREFDALSPLRSDVGGDLIADLLPALVGVASAAMVAKARLVLHQGGGGWTIDVIRHPTRLRAERVVYTEAFDDPGALIDRAYQLTAHIQDGRGRLYW